MILQQAWKMSLDKLAERRERIAAMILIKDCYAMKLDLLSSATVIDRAMKFVERNRGLKPQNMEVRIDQYMDPAHTAQATDSNNNNNDTPKSE
jgi:hypothetical protein